MEPKYDVLVIGAGLGGLSCAARLANLGYRVGVLEKHTLIGGYASHFKRRGFLFDVSLHGTAGLEEGKSLHSILTACDVAKRITPLSKRHPYSVKVGNEVLSVPQDHIEYKEMLCRMYPEDRAGIHRLFQDLKNLDQELKFLSSPDVSNWKKGMLFPFKCRLLLKWSRMTTYQVLRHYVSSVSLSSFFTVLWAYYGLPPKKLSALYFFIPWIGYHMEGTYYIQGGGQSLSDAFAEAIREKGGDVFTRKEVKQIITIGNLVSGVQLSDGSAVTARWVISNASPVLTFNELLANDVQMHERYSTKLNQLEVGSSLTQLYLGLEGDPATLGITQEETVILEEADHELDYERAMHGFYDKVNLIVNNYNLMDPTLNPGDKGVVTVTWIDRIGNWPERGSEYERKKGLVTDKILERLERHYPGIRKNVVVAELGTPRTMQRYTSNPEGAVYGYAQTVKQSGIRRLSSRTPYRNLSLVGAWTQPGGGYQGAILSGFMEAERIARKLKIKG
ncbi:phytoene desaturase family protein [Effusibacillus lacus]|uniref:Phytoene dehydrogenase n=1 Tax=Effusibacillus lacus TaxID=1348429 RepID=A0A292YM13_9BACL|nr:NAD(P)/FAD-dependent oxidoreductase [Effusibacillus lacus]TCS75655.1 prolycopene isomerase [Effusibacillus lacus]GAX90978.1 phytoene dehydrogenase [Effusibacillus lacus]